MDNVFEFLFKYRPFVFERGDFTFGGPVGVIGALLIATAVVVPTVIMYRSVRAKTTPLDRAALSAIRVAVVAVLLFVIARPMLILATTVPQQNFLGIVLDDSRSMQVADLDGRPRLEVMERVFGDDEDLHRRLSDRFILRFFSFASDASRVTGVEELTFEGQRTSVVGGLARARQELANVPVAGLVLVTDGADNSDETLDEAIVPLQAAGIPVFTVGAGREEFDRDIALRRVEVPRSVLKGTSLAIDLMIAQRGFGRERVDLYVEDSGGIVEQREIELPVDGDVARVRVHVTADQSGPRQFRFRIPHQEGELVTQNNEQQALVVVEDRREKILYFEGEPRFEVGFMRRAVADDQNLQLVVLQRTAEDKFLRLDVDDESELLSGFPRTRQELFQYRGLILGSVEASAFTHDQLQMIADFVSQRGGGLLLLGGRRAFVEGGFIGTPVEDALPVVLDPEDAGRAVPPWMVDVRITPAGQTHPLSQVADTEDASAERWSDLPPLSAVNAVTRVKPGAVTLLTGSVEGRSDEQVVLAHHRYGRGKVIVFTVQDSWMWQMHAEIPLEDQTHERLWKQMLRWLVSYVPEHVNVETPRDHTAPGESVPIRAEVEDETYLHVNNTDVVANVIDPLGVSREIPLEWVVERDGVYDGSFVPTDRGLYEIEVQAFDDGELAGADTTYFTVEDLDTEFYAAEMRAGALRRIASETGGRFYELEDVESLPDDVTITESGTTVVERRDLWDMPIVFLVLVGLLATEWTYRRARGLA